MTLQLSRKNERGAFAVAWDAARSRKYLLNVILACIAVGLEIYYSLCGGSCSYLKGDLLGIPLQHVGIVYMACIVLLSLLKRDTLLLLLLSAGVGIEVYLVAFQIWYNTYCPYCLAFGAIVFILFLLNLSQDRKRLSLISMAIALILFSIFFQGSAAPSYAEELLVPVFGQGKVNVRLYTDYFCGPCRAMEPDVEPLLAELVKKRKINITFIDTPFSRHSPLYASYYLYAMNERKELERAFAARKVLMEAAEQKIAESAKIEALLSQKGIKIKLFNPKPVFDAFNRALKEDGINSTPTMVVENGGNKEKVGGGADIVKALKRLN